MNDVQRINAASMFQIRRELQSNYASGIVKYDLRREDADILIHMSDEEIFTAAISTSEPVFTIRPIMRELKLHASGGEFDLLLSVVKQRLPVSN